MCDGASPHVPFHQVIGTKHTSRFYRAATKSLRDSRDIALLH
jgi:hypothetical protein